MTTYGPNRSEDPDSAIPKGNRGFLLFKPLPRNSIVGNIRVSHLWLLTVVLISGAIGGGALLFSAFYANTLLTRTQPLISDNSRLSIQVLQADSAARSYLLTSESTFQETFRQEVTAYQSIYQHAISLASANSATANLLEQENFAAQNVFALDKQLSIGLPKNATSPLVAQQNLPTLTKAVTDFHLKFTQVSNYMANNEQSAITRLRIYVFSALFATVLVIALGLILGIRRATRTHRKVEQLLERLTSTLKALENGSDSVRAAETGLAEEQALAKAINTMADQRLSLMSQLEIQYQNEKDLREGLEYERNLNESLAATYYRGPNAHDALQKAVEGFGSALRADWGFVQTIENGLPSKAAISTWKASHVELFTNRHKDLKLAFQQHIFDNSELIAHTVKSGQILVIEDLFADSRIEQNIRDMAVDANVRAMLVIPVIGANGTEAILTAIMESSPGQWNERDIQVAETMADGLATTLMVTKLYEQETLTVERLKELDEAKDAFVASVSHELRTPLTSIVGYLELLQDEVSNGSVDKKHTRMLNTIERNSKRLLNLVEDLLTVSRIDSGRLELQYCDVRVDQLLSQVAEVVLPQAQSKDVHFNVEIAGAAPTISGDPNLLERAILNLTVNAIKFTPPGGTVDIHASTDGGKLVLTITDTGIGIPENEVKELFTRFYRTSNARSSAIQGTGLGLVIAKAIVESHSGTIEVKSELEKGTVFTIKIPLRVIECSPDSNGSPNRDGNSHSSIR